MRRTLVARPSNRGISVTAGVRSAVDDTLGVDAKHPGSVDCAQTVDSNGRSSVDVDDLGLAVLLSSVVADRAVVLKRKLERTKHRRSTEILTLKKLQNPAPKIRMFFEFSVVKAHAEPTPICCGS